jgi:hypothetical protein
MIGQDLNKADKFYLPRKNVIFLSSVRWQQGAAHAQIAKGTEKKPYMDFE